PIVHVPIKGRCAGDKQDTVFRSSEAATLRQGRSLASVATPALSDRTRRAPNIVRLAKNTT
ncbi:hypothetical protein V5799_007572, partial [Amblyomma americanum]